MMTDIKTMKVTAEQLESLSEVNRISALKIGEMQAEIDELKARINALGWVLESEGKITKTDWSRIRDQHKGEWYEQSKK